MPLDMLSLARPGDVLASGFIRAPWRSHGWACWHHCSGGSSPRWGWSGAGTSNSVYTTTASAPRSRTHCALETTRTTLAVPQERAALQEAGEEERSVARQGHRERRRACVHGASGMRLSSPAPHVNETSPWSRREPLHGERTVDVRNPVGRRTMAIG